MKNKKAIFLVILIIMSLILYLGLDYQTLNTYILKSRTEKLIAILIVAITTSFSTLIFQTMTNHPLLTPNVLGMDYLFILSSSIALMTRIQLKNTYWFYIQLVLMVITGMLIYLPLIKKNQHMDKIILIGMTLSTLLNILSSVLMYVMDPNEYLIVQGKTIASLSKINVNILSASIVLTIIIALIIYKKHHVLDVLNLGHEQAISLGVNVKKENRLILIFTLMLTAITTALVGPLGYLGFIGVHLSKAHLKDYRHQAHLLFSSLIIWLIMMISILVVEKLLKQPALVGMFMNLIGSIYFMVYMIKETKK